MDVVLGLSITSGGARAVLVEGATGDGATVRTIRADNAYHLVDALVAGEAFAAARDNRLRAIGVTWTNEAESAAAGALQALAASGFENVIPVSDLEAADALARGVAELATYDDVAVCIVEPDAAVVAIVRPDEVITDRFDRSLDGADADDLVRGVIAMLEDSDSDPELVLAVGSADDLDSMVSSLDAAVPSPVISAAEAGLALARGAALSSAQAMSGLDAQVAPAPEASDALPVDDDKPGRAPWLTSRVGALASVLAAAVLTFVVSSSVALGLGLTPDRGSGTPEQRQVAIAADEPPVVAGAPSIARAASRPPSIAAPPPAPPPVAAEKIAAAVPPPEAAPAPEPAFEPPAAAPVAPPPAAPPAAPAYVPPPPPNYVPQEPPTYSGPGTPVPGQTYPQPQPRLRDRIIERIPIINRFHEPQVPYPYP